MKYPISLITIWTYSTFISAKPLGLALIFYIVTLFLYTSSNTIVDYPATGEAGCLKPIDIPNAVAGGGIQYSAFTTTFATNDANFCTTLTAHHNAE